MQSAQERGGHLIAAPGWSAVCSRNGTDFLSPLVAWLRPEPGTALLLVGMTLAPDGRAVVRADLLEGFKCYLPPADWIAELGPAG